MSDRIDFGSSAAQSYMKLFERMLDEARVRNDGLGLDESETNQIRGRIAVLKELIALPTRQRNLDAQSRNGHPD